MFDGGSMAGFNEGFLKFLGNAGTAGLALLGGEGVGAIIQVIATRIPLWAIDERMDSDLGMGLSKVSGKVITSAFFYTCAVRAGVINPQTGKRTYGGRAAEDFLHAGAIVNAAGIPVDILDTIMDWRESKKLEGQMGPVGEQSISLKESNLRRVRAKDFTEMMRRSKMRS